MGTAVQDTVITPPPPPRVSRSLAVTIPDVTEATFEDLLPKKLCLKDNGHEMERLNRSTQEATRAEPEMKQDTK